MSKKEALRELIDEITDIKEMFNIKKKDLTNVCMYVMM